LEFYGNEARSQDINTVRYAIGETLPLDPLKDVITPPIIGSKKSIRGWNHNMTAAALCPLRLRAEFDEDPLCVHFFSCFFGYFICVSVAAFEARYSMEQSRFVRETSPHSSILWMPSTMQKT
jgi:hypothetical protein